MSDSISGAAAPELTAVSQAERISALDIIRGFALIGIAMMNVEWFTRPITELGSGVDPSQSGIHYAASWFVYTFIQGKFWTMFSLLFGMGFAVMLDRAEVKGRAFVTPYMRRILGLFLFGSAHFVMIWTGDILHNYAITAIALLLVVTRSWKTWGLLLLSALATGIGLQLAGSDSAQAGFMNASFLGLTGLLMFFLHRGSVARYWKWGVAIYSIPFLIGLCVASYQVITHSPDQPKPELDAKAQAEADKEKTEQTKRFNERKIERQKERQAEIDISTKASYAESVVHRAKEYAKDLPTSTGLSFLALPMFLIGFWFVRAGVMANIQQHRAIFTRLATVVLPIGLVMTAISVSLHTSFGPPATPEGRDPTMMLAGVLFQWSMLPMCLGYVGALVCLLQTRLGQTLLSPLRHAGQMALTNYIGASLILSTIFSGYGLGYYGQIPRASQLLLVLVMFAAQLAFSKFWLQHFRYGPLEWAWRAITYWTLPPMRRQATELEPAIA